MVWGAMAACLLVALQLCGLLLVCGLQLGQQRLLLVEVLQQCLVLAAEPRLEGH